MPEYDSLREAGAAMHNERTTGDSQQFSQDQRFEHGENGGVVPRVKLLWMTPDPLGAVAALASMYEGRVIRDMNDLTDNDRRRAWENTQATHLRAPLEAVKLHFLIEGVDRAFTHQLVRQRTAVYAQESLRFAVVDDLGQATTLPPSLRETERYKDWHRTYMQGWESADDKSAYNKDHSASKQQQWRAAWDHALDEIQEAYDYLVNDGMPAEEARGLLPHCTATRIQYVTDLRNLAEHAGNRLCTQAQFHWRQILTQIVEQIGNYNDDRLPGEHWDNGEWMPDDVTDWQYEMIAESGLFRPICYQLGRCPFQATFDRECTIRERVQAFSKHGIASQHWSVPNLVPVVTADEGDRGGEVCLHHVNDEEWRMDPGAARA